MVMNFDVEFQFVISTLTSQLCQI